MFEALTIATLAVVSSYHVGNSLTADGTVWLGAIAQQAGQTDYDIGVHVDSNQSLHTIWATPAGVGGIDMVRPPFGTWDNALANYHWDSVVLEPWHGSGATLGSDKQMIANFIDYTRSNPANADTVFYIYQYWPHQSWGRYSDFWQGGENPADTTLTRPRAANYQYLMDWARETYVPQGVVVRQVPTGEVWHQVSLAIEAGQFADLTMTDFYRDDLHASWQLGRYLATATIFATIHQTDLIGTPAPPEFLPFYSQEVFDQLNKIIWDVVSGDPDTGIADFNDDGWTDEADLSVLLSGYGQNGLGDTDGDNDTDGRDFLSWQRTYRAAEAAGGLSLILVPEPGSMTLAGLLGVSLFLRRSTHRDFRHQMRLDLRWGTLSGGAF